MWSACAVGHFLLMLGAPRRYDHVTAARVSPLLCRYYWGAAGSFPPVVAVDLTVFTGGVNVFATNKYDPTNTATLPNGNNTDPCLQRMTRAGTLTLDPVATGSPCFSNQVGHLLWLRCGSHGFHALIHTLRMVYMLVPSPRDECL